MIVMGVAGTCTGQIWGRYGQVADRAKNPKGFWFGVAAYYLCGIGLIAYYFYKIYAFSN